MRKLAVPLVLSFSTLACQEPKASTEKETVPTVRPAAPAAKPILVDGSTTVDPLSRGIVDLYASELTSDVKLEASGTGAGFKKFCRKQTHINEASRPISSAEQKLCETEGVTFIELPVAFDAIAVVVPRENEFLRSLTKRTLEKLWARSSENSLKSWNGLDPKFPKEPISLFGPGIDSGTFDFFSEAIVGGADGIRSDYDAKSRPAPIADGVAKTNFGLGFLSFAHYLKHERDLRTVAIDDENDENGKGAIEPSKASISDGTYQPLSRPLFLYVNVRELDRPELLAFIDFYLRSARLVAPDVGYAPLPKSLFSLAKKRLDERRPGSIFTGGEANVGLTIEELLSAEAISIGEAPASPAK